MSNVHTDIEETHQENRRSDLEMTAVIVDYPTENGGYHKSTIKECRGHFGDRWWKSGAKVRSNKDKLRRDYN